MSYDHMLVMQLLVADIIIIIFYLSCGVGFVFGRFKRYAIVIH